mmetsp:Transcript_44866/g.104589  ORF Transcript_44866/g.104589 Transcript_44866/m.104589 type:complete len:471 (+) Transcript_44866:34-1446(+)
METVQGTWVLGTFGEVHDSHSSPGSVPVALEKSLSEAETLQSMETTSPGSDKAGMEMVPPKDHEEKEFKEHKDIKDVKDVNEKEHIPTAWQARHHQQWQQWQWWHWQNQQRMPPLQQPRQISLQPLQADEVEAPEVPVPLNPVNPEHLAGKTFRSIQELGEAMNRSRSMEDVNTQKSKMPPPPPPPPPPPGQKQQFQGGMTLQTGTVRRLFPGKGFGFVARDDGGRGARHGRGDVFLHFSDLEPGVGSSELAVGARVRFHWEESADPQRGPGGRARRVSLTDLPEPGNATIVVPGSVNANLAVARVPGITWSSGPTALATPAARPRHTGRVYRRESLLAVQAKLRSAGQLRGSRPPGVPRLLPMPKWYWDNDDCLSEDETDDEARLRALEARLDRENGADAKNVETFGEAWAGEAWSFEDALAANQRIAARRVASPPICLHPGIEDVITFERRDHLLEEQQPIIPTMILQ